MTNPAPVNNILNSKFLMLNRFRRVLLAPFLSRSDRAAPASSRVRGCLLWKAFALWSVFFDYLISDEFENVMPLTGTYIPPRSVRVRAKDTQPRLPGPCPSMFPHVQSSSSNKLAWRVLDISLGCSPLFLHVG